MTRFVTTRWSQILASHQGPEGARRALEAICIAYREPVLAYIRHHGYGVGDAEDLAQEFFARLVERRWDMEADPGRGRFRALLLTALRRHLSDQLAARHAQRRGGGRVPLDADDPRLALAGAAHESPEHAFDRTWALTLLQRAFERLQREAVAAGKGEQFERLAEFIAEPAVGKDYRALGAALGLRSNTLAVTVHRLRLRLRELVREELLETVGSEHDLDAEMAHLRGALADRGLH